MTETSHNFPEQVCPQTFFLVSIVIGSADGRHHYLGFALNPLNLHAVRVCPDLLLAHGSGQWWCCNGVVDIFLAHLGP